MTDVALVVEGSYPYVTGGVSAWVQQLIEGLPDVSFSVANLGGADIPAYERPANLVEIVDLELDPETGESAGELPEASVYHALATGSASSAAARAARDRNGAFVLSEHGLAWLEARLGIVGCGPKHVNDADRIEAQARRAYREASVVTAVCAWSARRQASLGASGVRVLENAAFLSEGERERDASAPLIGFVGRVVPVKDVLAFIDACRAIADEVPAARFVVVGPLDQDAEYAERCHARAESLALDVLFTGASDPSAWYAQLDALVLTSRSEAQPLVALEAMAAGVPVVATDVGGCADLLRGCGLVTRVGDPAQTAAAVLRVLRDEHLRATLTNAARFRIEQRHAPAALAGSFRSLYEAAA